MFVDPLTDFRSLGNVCAIESYSIRSSRRRKAGCKDAFTYSFRVTDAATRGLTDETYNSKEVEITRCEDCTCEDTSPAGNPHSEFEPGGPLVQCWEPTNEDVKSKAYDCGKPDLPCIKIFDPAEDTEGIESKGNEKLVLCAITFPISSICLVLILWRIIHDKEPPRQPTIRESKQSLRESKQQMRESRQQIQKE